MVINRCGGNFAILKSEYQKFQKIYGTKLSFTYKKIYEYKEEVLDSLHDIMVVNRQPQYHSLSRGSLSDQFFDF